MENNNLERKRKKNEKKAKVTLYNGVKLGLSFFKKVFKAFYKDLVLPLYQEMTPIIAIGIIALVCKEYNIFWSDDMIYIVALFALLQKRKE